jgi:lysophospholipase L1-like esterase
MTRTIVCYGDSNTHGAHPDPLVHDRIARDRRWPGVMRIALGEGYEVIEEALGGRCTVWDTPLSPGRNGLAYLAPCLESHEPVDLVIIMLGTNDTKRIYGLTAPEIASGASVLVDVARGSLAGPGGTPPRVILVAPAPLGEPTLHGHLWGFGASRDESLRLAELYRLVAEDRDIGFFDAGSVAAVSPLDGVHLDEEAHAALGAAMADAVRAELARA